MKHETKTIERVATEQMEPAARGGVQMPPAEAELNKRVARAWERAKSAGINYTIRVIETGLLLLEVRSSIPGDPDDMSRACHSGTPYLLPSINGHNQHTRLEARFNTRLASLGIPTRTAYRWMEMAENVARYCLHLDYGEDMPVMTGSDNSQITLSEALLEGANVTGQALQFRNSMLEFLEHKNLSDVAAAIADGQDSFGHIRRVFNGSVFGGKARFGRKNFVYYLTVALSNAASHIGAKESGESGDGRKGGHWDALTPKQQQQAKTILDAFFSALPDELVDYCADSSKTEAAERRRGNKRADPMAVKKQFGWLNDEMIQAIREDLRTEEED